MQLVIIVCNIFFYNQRWQKQRWFFYWSSVKFQKATYIHYKFLILADCHTRGITLIACPILPRRCLWPIAISLQSLRSLLRPPIKINIVNINHTNTCNGNYKQLPRKINHNNKLIKNLKYKTTNISCFGMGAWKKQYVMFEWWRYIVIHNAMLNKKRTNTPIDLDAYNKTKWLTKSLTYNDDWMNNYG